VCTPRYGGFAMAVRLGLSLVATPYVMVVQHDRALTRRFGLERVLDAMDANRGRVNYVGLPSNSTAHRARAAFSKTRYGLDVSGLTLPFPELGFALEPLLFWYDSTHVASADFYRDVVFGWVSVPDTPFAKPFRLRTGDFVEDKFGQAMLRDIKAHGPVAHAKYGAFMFSEDLAPQPSLAVYVRHWHGRYVGVSRLRTVARCIAELPMYGAGGGGEGAGGDGAGAGGRNGDSDQGEEVVIEDDDDERGDSASEDPTTSGGRVP